MENHPYHFIVQIEFMLVQVLRHEYERDEGMKYGLVNPMFQVV